MASQATLTRVREFCADCESADLNSSYAHEQIAHLLDMESEKARRTEREACALVASRYVEATGIELKTIETPTMAVADCADEIAATIRARGDG